MRNCSSSSHAEEHVSDLANKNEFIEVHLVTRHSPMILPYRRVKLDTHHFERK
jgi:hypothetical protein